MTLTSKQRAKLNSIANDYETIFQVGKNGLGDDLITSLNEAIEVRELIKIKVLETCELTAKEAAQEIAPKLNAEIVRVIGTKIILYRQQKNPKKRKIVIDD